MIKNKKIVITGAGSGIGKSIKEKLQSFSGNIICSVNSKSEMDLTNFKNIETIANQIKDLDILINCAGYIEPMSIEDTPLNIWKTHIDTNLTSIFYLTKLLIPKFNENSVILNITSPSAKKTRKNWSSYCCSKAALNNFTMNCSLELEEKNIYVNALSPTKTNTPMIKKLFPDLSEDELIKPDIIANIATDIICESLNKITGNIYEVFK